MNRNAAKEEKMTSQLIESPKTDDVREYKMVAGGEWVDARSGETRDPFQLG